MWDRWAVLVFGTLVALDTARWAGGLWGKGMRLAGVGGGLLALVALGVPLLLVALGAAGGG